MNFDNQVILLPDLKNSLSILALETVQALPSRRAAAAFEEENS